MSDAPTPAAAPAPAPSASDGPPAAVAPVPAAPVHRTLGRFWTVPNALSLARCALTFPLAWLVWQDGPLSTVGWLLGVGILTDALDGLIARASKTVSEWGKVLDPLADKLAMVLVGLALAFRVSEPRLPLALVGATLLRDVLIVLGGVLLARRAGTVPPSLFVGKAFTAVFAFAVVLVVFRADRPVLDAVLLATWALLGLSFLAYLGRFLRAWRRPRIAPAPSPA